VLVRYLQGDISTAMEGNYRERMKRVLLSMLFCHRLPIIVFFLLLFISGPSCSPARNGFMAPLADPGRDPYNSARLTCFLTLESEQGPAMRLEVASVEVLAIDGMALPLTGAPLRIDSAAIGGGQIFLGGRAVPPGRYQKLRLTVTKGELRKGDGEYAVMINEPFLLEMNIPGGLDLEQDDSRSLLLSWDVQNSIQVDNKLSPALGVTTPVRELLIDLVFVACPDIDTVFVVRADRNWVVDSFGLRGKPTYLAVDPDLSRGRLYILAAGDRMVKVVDLASYRVIDFFPVFLNDDPTFMTLSPDGRAAFLLDERSGYLSRMDLATGRNVARVFLGYRPKYATYLEGRNRLAVSLSLSQRVVLLDPVSLAIIDTISSGSGPQGMVVSDNQLYIAESGDNSLAVIDLANRASRARLEVGLGPRRLLEAGNQIYVSNYQDGSVSVLAPGQLGVIREIHGLRRPQEMVFDQVYRRLYVADEEAAALAVIDVNANLLLRHISLGARPFGLAVIQ
jgi:YVTN family beta-propeller protein